MGGEVEMNHVEWKGGNLAEGEEGKWDDKVGSQKGQEWWAVLFFYWGAGGGGPEAAGKRR